MYLLPFYLQARRDWQEILSHEKWRPIAKVVLPNMLSFSMEGQIKSFPDKTKGVPRHQTIIM